MVMLDVFAGIGMFSLGGHWAGCTTAAFVEWDKHYQMVLAKNFPNTKIYGDVKEFDGTRYRGTVDIVCGGFPCQPYSIAGGRKGAEDDRDQWPQLLRVCNEVRPAWFIGENVANILTMEPERFLCDLESIGYQAAILDFRACSVGLQILERHIWFIATPDEKRLERVWQKTVPDQQVLQREFQGSDSGIRGRRDISESRFCRVGERNTSRLDKSSRERLKQIGNAIPPQMAYQIINSIISIN